MSYPCLASIEVNTGFRKWIERNSLNLCLMTVMTVTITFSKETFDNLNNFLVSSADDYCKQLDPQWGTLIFSHIHRLFGRFKILNFNIFWVFRKMNIFWGYEDFLDIFGGSSQNKASLRVISMHFIVFF